MALLRRLFRDGITGWPADHYFARWSPPTASGITITEETALSIGAVFACVRVLAEAVSTLPLITYRRLPRGKERAPDHYLYPVLHDAANPEQPAAEFRELLTAHLQLWGNAYAEIERDGAGRVRALWPLPPWRVRPVRAPGSRALVYLVRGDDGVETPLIAENALHLRGLSLNGTTGLSVVGLARETLGLSAAALTYGAAFFGNGAMPAAVLEYPGKLSDQARTNITESWEQRHGGPRAAGRLALLEEGMKYQQAGLPPEDVQFLETRKFSRNEIAMWFRVPPHMVGDLDRATFSNIEHQSQEFVTYSLMPWLVRWESRAAFSLLLPSERRTYFVEHLLAALLRGDTLARNQAYAIGRQWGYLSANDVREAENLNPVEGGDLYLVPLNMVPADQAALPPEPEPEPQGDGGDSSDGEGDGQGRQGRALAPGERRSLEARRRLATSYRRVFRDAAVRVLRREEADVMREARRLFAARDARDDMVRFLERFYADHRAFVSERLRAGVLALAEAVAAEALEEINAEAGRDLDLETMVDAWLAEFADEHAGISRRQLMQALAEGLESGDPLAALQERFDGWGEDDRAGVIAQAAAVAAGAATAKHVWRRHGVPRLRWHAFGGSCAYCRALDGRIVSIDVVFLDAGDELLAEGKTSAFRPSRPTRHPPLHGACDCVITPAF